MLMIKFLLRIIIVVWENFMKVRFIFSIEKNVQVVFLIVTVARAMNAKQDNQLISSICNKISQYFDEGGKEKK